MVDLDVAGWPLVTVNRQRDMRRLLVGKAATVDHGKKMAERWARANLARLQVDVAVKKAGRPVMPWLPRAPGSKANTRIKPTREAGSA